MFRRENLVLRLAQQVSMYAQKPPLTPALRPGAGAAAVLERLAVAGRCSVGGGSVGGSRMLSEPPASSDGSSGCLPVAGSTLPSHHSCTWALCASRLALTLGVWGF